MLKLISSGLRNPSVFKSCQDAPRERTEFRGNRLLVMRILVQL